MARKGKVPKKTKKWFTSECQGLKNKLSRLATNLKKNPFNNDAKIKYRTAYQAYKTLLRKEERNYNKNMKQKLLEIEGNDPKSFWNLISSMQGGKENNEMNNDLFRSIEKYHDYFSKLYNNSEISRHTEPAATVFQSLLNQNLRGSNVTALLDAPFTEEEVIECASDLKCGKAPGPDRILNEFLKLGHFVLAKPITKLFNLTQKTEMYPNAWSVNILSTIHKGGSTDNLDNFRGISVGSCFSKLLGCVLGKRLEKSISTFQLIERNQIGFLKNSRTSDHIFVVNTLVNKIVKSKGKYLYSAFIDLRKAYDSVNRNFLFSKLWAMGLGGKSLSLIKSMYKSVQQCIKLNHVVIEPIMTTLGLKQGCNLSPLLFNLFIEDLKMEFDITCDQVKLGSVSFSHLLFADDLVLLSTSQVGLQECLNRLSNYCNRWGLNINLKKSNVMIFNKTGRIPKGVRFTCGGADIPLTNRYKYLGILLSSSGSFKPAIDNLCDRSRKAYFAVREVLSKVGFDSTITLKIFD